MRRFRYKSAEYDKVHAWIKKAAAAAADEKEDEKSPEPLTGVIPSVTAVYPNH